MPSKAMKQCPTQGCFKLLPGNQSHCKEHKPESFKRSKDYVRNPFYDSPEWRKTSKLSLSLTPLCVHCTQKGKVTAAVHSDHIVPIEQGGAKLDLNNLMSLCLKCHSSKSAKERK